MAKNLFEQILNKAGEIWSGPKNYGDHQIYRDETSELSGVARYLAKLEQAAIQQEQQQAAAQLTGVAKYLAMKEGGASTQTVVAAAEPEPEESIVEAVVEVAPTTGVGKYLARKVSGNIVPVVVEPPKPAETPKTGVGRYLAGLPRNTVEKAPEPEVKKRPLSAVDRYLAASADKKPAPAPAKPAAAPPAAAAKPAATSSSVIHFENVTQCQASTVKGTQCKNTTHLVKMQRTINKQKYQFFVCSQHHNDSFKPYAPLLEN